MSGAEKIRLDIWLHRARLFKSRSQATHACREGKVMIRDKFADAGDAVHAGDTIKLRVSGLYRSYKILEAADINLSKQEAKRMYEETTTPETLERFQQIDLANRDWRSGARRESGPRPTKKDRRNLDEYRKR